MSTPSSNLPGPLPITMFFLHQWGPLPLCLVSCLFSLSIPVPGSPTKVFPLPPPFQMHLSCTLPGPHPVSQIHSGVIPLPLRFPLPSASYVIHVVRFLLQSDFPAYSYLIYWLSPPAPLHISQSTSIHPFYPASLCGQLPLCNGDNRILNKRSVRFYTWNTMDLSFS